MHHSTDKISIFWFRRDLRIEDNHGLFNALSSGNKILPIFIYDQNILSQLDSDDSRVTFIHQLLTEINHKLSEYGSSVATFFGNPIDVFKKLIANHDIESVFTNRDYEPYAIVRDLEIESLLTNNKIGFLTFNDHVIFDTNEIVKSDGSPYLVFTPFSKKWKSEFNPTHVKSHQSEELLHKSLDHIYPFFKLSDIGFKPSSIQVDKINIDQQTLSNYSKTRNFPVKPTSFLGAHLRFGSVSIRKIVSLASSHQDEIFLNELIWREFFIQILFHFPHTVNRSFKPQYDHIVWRNDESEFKKWCEGKTGYPMVDAGMRQLNATGFMHNRVRMITAGFLCKHLLIDWRWGEAYFATKLLDYEQASNVGNWQWAAGSGVDAAPYFRIFNPSEQLRKFDQNFEYVKKWVPDFQDFTYPQPVVEHTFARERCVTTYKAALSQV